MKKKYFFIVFLWTQLCFGQQTRGLYVPDGVGVRPAQQEKRIALVIGNKSYHHWQPLANPVNDAHLMATVLEECGFLVTELPDADKDAMIHGIETFAEQISGNETVALFFYAGHGIEAFGKNYLIPTSDHSKCRDDLSVKSVDLEYIQRKLAAAAMTILVVDACRDNRLPFTCVGPVRPTDQQGFVETKPNGIFIGFSTAPGTTALDGIGQKNSPYTAALAEVIRNSTGEEIESIFRTVRSRVKLKGQLTWHHSGYDGKFFFKPAAPESERDKDSDGDGILDRVDLCPNESGPLSNKGCPIEERDSDDDGTPDVRDKCPKQFGEPEDGGCPNYTEDELKFITSVEEAKKIGSDSFSFSGSLKRVPSIIKQLKGLKKLNLETDNILGLRELRHLKSLKELYLGSIQLSDLSTLQELKQLTTLGFCVYGIQDISKIMPMLRELKQLTALYLGHNDFSNLSMLQELTQLKELNLKYNGIADLSTIMPMLRELKQLTGLGLKGNEIRDISALRELKQLKILILSDNQINDISALRELKQLEILGLSDNQINDISALRELKQLTILELSDNKIQNFNLDLTTFPNLNELDLGHNPIQNIPDDILGSDCASELRAYQKQQRKK